MQVLAKHRTSANYCLTYAASMVVALLLVGCGAKERPASQVAAKVNKEEISVHQINFILERQQGIRPENADIASKAILERLIDQELAVQKASELKLDRDPQIVQGLEAARRDVLARAYQDRITEAVSRPSDEELNSYYSSKPALFKERRIYQLDEINIETSAESTSEIRKSIESLRSLADVKAYLKGQGLAFSENQVIRAAEQLPLASVDTFSKMTEGQNLVSAASAGLQVVVVVSARPQPVTFEMAKPAISQYIINSRKRDFVEKSINDLRSNSKIEYVGAFATGGGNPNEVASTSDHASAAASASSASGASLDAPTINKGMGIK